MSGTSVQIGAKGAQDVYLIGDPQITFFKTIYKRHTNFALETLKLDFDKKNQSISQERVVTISCKIDKNGDLLHQCYVFLDYTLASGESSSHYGHNFLRQIDLEIGGKLIDRHYSQWLQVWNELTREDYKKSPSLGRDTTLGAYNNTANQDDSYRKYDMNYGYMRMADRSMSNTSGSSNRFYFYVPLLFWFCRNPGLALPLIALNFEDVYINITLEPQNHLTGNGTSSQLNEINLYCNYIYLEPSERDKFVTNTTTYLIDQLQTLRVDAPTDSSSSVSVPLEFKNSCKEIIWAIHRGGAHVGSKLSQGPDALFPLCQSIGQGADNTTTISGTTDGIGGSVSLLLDGVPRFTQRPISYFTRIQPLEHHTNVPTMDRIGVYSFALHPEESFPTGSCNFSLFPNSELNIQTGISNTNARKLYIFAPSFNLYRISQGISELAFDF